MTMTSAMRSSGQGLVEELDGQLRAVVRREGLDPQRDVAAVRRAAESLVTAHDERSLTGAVAPVEDPAALVGELLARVAGFGPLQRYLDDPEVEEVWINAPDRVFIAKDGKHELTTTILTREQVQELVERMLKTSGRRIDLSQPFVDAMLPQGHRLHVVLEGISRDFAAVNIRKFTLKAARLDDLVRLGSLTRPAARFLEASVLAGLNIVVAGGTQAGKTTMLNCLAAAIPGGDRVISAEEVFELRNLTIMQTCALLSTSDKVSTDRGPALPLRGSVTTASDCAVSAAGKCSASSRTTTCRRPRASLARRTARWSPRSRMAKPTPSWRGTSTA